jgi:molybdopterin-guanine dinucleotide biosynthesis protein B
MKIFSITGWSGSGKTELITRLIRHSKMKNQKVVAVKNVPHKFYLEPESADTFRFLEAGADEVCLTAARQLLTMRSLTGETDVIALLEQEYADCDYLLLEGLRKDGVPMIEVFDPAKHDTPKVPIHKLCAMVSEKPVIGGIPHFHPDEIDKIISFMEVYNG